MYLPKKRYFVEYNRKVLRYAKKHKISDKMAFEKLYGGKK